MVMFVYLRLGIFSERIYLGERLIAHVSHVLSYEITEITQLYPKARIIQQQDEKLQLHAYTSYRTELTYLKYIQLGRIFQIKVTLLRVENTLVCTH